MSQQMVLSPQLQQSLALLQAPVLELKAMVEQEMQQNPMLEEAPTLVSDPAEQREEEEAAAVMADPAEPPADTRFDPATEAPDSEPVDKFDQDLQKVLRLDQEWRDFFSSTSTPVRSNPDEEERRQYLLDSITGELSLQEELMDQVRSTDLSDLELQIAELVVGNIDDNGYLRSSVSELSMSTGVPVADLEEAVKLVQSFDPAGVGAIDLRQCLMLQLERIRCTHTPEYRILRDHMDALGKRKFPEIARHLGITAAEAQKLAANIAKLDPRPGRKFSAEPEHYVVPEVVVSRGTDGEWVASVVNDLVPTVRISNTYKDLLAMSETSSEVREYIRERIKSGKFLIKSIHQRQSTILNIAREILKRQQDFMEKGVAHLKPMTMLQLAEAVGVHETTVSRAVSGKYMSTPQGVFEMKYFFTSGLATASGEQVSNKSVKTALAELIANESKSSPLSDEELVSRLKAQGTMIARRTVAKYRAELGVLPSHLRKVY
jgi:RNA polymerase sigma-54 factor